MQIRLAAPVQFDSIVDGPGLRAVVWTQGCTRACPGCHNPETWDSNAGFLTDTEEIKKQLSASKLQQGLTFSGGEPFLQIQPLVELADFVRQNLAWNVWAFSGYTYEELAADANKKILLPHLDVLVDGSFMLAQRDPALQFRGSRNQRVLYLKNGAIDHLDADCLGKDSCSSATV